MGLFGKKKKKKTVVTALIGSSTHIDSNFLSFSGGIHIRGHVGLDVVASEDSSTGLPRTSTGLPKVLRMGTGKPEKLVPEGPSRAWNKPSPALMTTSTAPFTAMSTLPAIFN